MVPAMTQITSDPDGTVEASTSGPGDGRPLAAV